MPLNGRIWAVDKLRLKVASSASGSHSGDGTGQYSHGATAATYSTPNTSDTDIGFLLTVGGASVPDEWSVYYEGPGYPGGVTFTGTGWGSVTAEIVLTDLVLYGEGSSIRLVCNYELFVQGVSEDSGSIDATSAGLGPAYIPLLGIPLGLSGACSATTTGLPTYAADDVYFYSSICNATATGGWEFEEVGTTGYIDLPMTLAPGSAPGSGGGCTDPGVGTVTGATTGALSVVSYSERTVEKTMFNSGTITECCVEQYCDDVLVMSDCIVQSPEIPYEQFKREADEISRSGSVRAVPNLEKAIKRFNQDFGALIYRHEMPQTKYTATSSCTETIGDDSPIVTTSGDPAGVVIHPYQDELLLYVDNDPAAIEDTLGFDTFAPWTQEGNSEKTIAYTEVASGVTECPALIPCPPDTEISSVVTTLVGYDPLPDDETYLATRSYSFPSDVGTEVATYLTHDGDLARYINSWGNPFWSFALFTDNWELDATPEDWNDYWKKVGSQHLYHASLSSPPSTRNHLVSEGLEADAHGPFCDSFVSGLRFLGIHRWQTKTVTPRTTYTYTDDSADLWAGTDCTLTHGAQLVINPSALTCEVALTLGDFEIEPFLWVHLANKITVDCEPDNVESIKGYLQAQDGSRVLLNDNQPGVAKFRPSGKSTEYAGSWAQDYGAGIATDIGADFMSPEGVSSGHMADPHLACAYQMLADRTASELVFVIEVTDADEDVTLEYPIFEYTLAAQRKYFAENAHQMCAIHPSGAGVRFGIWNTGTSGTINNPPALYDPTERPNIIDALVTERLLVRGVAHNDGLTTELTTRYDTYEGQSVGNARNTSWAFFLPPGNSDWPLALVNGPAELPPLGCFPIRERDPVTWLADGDFVQHTWIWAQEPDYFVNPQETPQLRADDDTTVWTSPGSAVAGWAVAKHTHAVDNDETDFGIWSHSERFAEDIRPFRGYYMVLLFAASGGITYVVARDLMHFAAYIGTDDFVVTEWADNGLAWDEVVQEFTATQVCYWCDVRGGVTLWLGYSDGVKVYVRTSPDGKNFSDAIERADGTRLIGVPLSDGGHFEYWFDSGDILGQQYDAGNTAIGSSFTAVSGADDVQFDAFESSQGSGGFRIVIKCIIGGTNSTKIAPDGINFV